MSPQAKSSVQDAVRNIRDLVAEADDIETKMEEVPEWGVTVELRAFSLQARSNFLDMMGVGQHEDSESLKGAFVKMYPALVIAACHDPESGAPCFTEEDRAMLLGKSGKVVDRLGGIIMEMNGMTEEAVDEAKKDSSTTPPGTTS